MEGNGYLFPVIVNFNIIFVYRICLTAFISYSKFLK